MAGSRMPVKLALPMLPLLLAASVALADTTVTYSDAELQDQVDVDNYGIKGLGYPASKKIGALIDKLIAAKQAADAAKAADAKGADAPLGK